MKIKNNFSFDPLDNFLDNIKYKRNGLIEKSLENGFDPNTTSDKFYKRTGLMIAMAEKNFEVMDTLLKFGADINLRDEYEWAAITYFFKTNRDQVNVNRIKEKEFLDYFQIFLNNGVDIHENDWAYLRGSNYDSMAKSIYERSTLNNQELADKSKKLLKL